MARDRYPSFSPLVLFLVVYELGVGLIEELGEDRHEDVDEDQIAHNHVHLIKHQPSTMWRGLWTYSP